MEKAIEEKKKYEQELAERQRKMQNSAEHDIESMASKLKEKEVIPSPNVMPPKSPMHHNPSMNRKRSSRMSQLRKVQTTEFNDADTELNFLREAVDNNLGKNELKQKLESKFKMQTNMFSDVVRNLGGIVSKSDIDGGKDEAPKNEIDSILQNIEKQHGKI